MMYSREIRALLWELWNRNRLLNTVAVLFLPLWIIAVRFNLFPEVPEEMVILRGIVNTLSASFVAFPGFFYLFYPIAVCSYAQQQMDSGERFGFPRRLYSLPLPTGILYAVPLLTCLLIYAVLGVLMLLLEDRTPLWQHWWIWFLIVTFAGAVVSASWSLASMRTFQVLLTIFAAILLIISSILTTEQNVKSAWRVAFFAIPPVILLTSIGGLIWSSRNDRHGN